MARWQNDLAPLSCGLYYKTITIVILMIVSDATIWSVTYDRNWWRQLWLKAKVKHIYSTGVIDDCHLRSSKYFYNTGHSLVVPSHFVISPFSQTTKNQRSEIWILLRLSQNAEIQLQIPTQISIRDNIYSPSFFQNLQMGRISLSVCPWHAISA